MKNHKRKTLKILCTPAALVCLPSQWKKPVIETVLLPAHAQSSPFCPSEPPFGIRVTVVDSSTGNNISCLSSGTLNNMMITTNLVHNHPFVPPSPLCTSQILGGAIDSPGIYSLQVDAPGYISHSESGIVVVAEECWTNTVDVNVSLSPI